MRKSNIILDKTFNFSIQIVELYKLLLVKHRVYDLARQVLKSGTSIGANAEEAVGGISKKDFRSKFSISLKENIGLNCCTKPIISISINIKN